MIKKVVIKNGKKYIVNCVGWEDGVGPGCPNGTLWMQSESDNNWYAVNVTGTSGSAAVYVNPNPINLQTNDLGYQLLINNDGNTYQVYLTGTSGSVTINVNSTPWMNASDYKPWFNLQSVTDGDFYQVYLHGSPPTLNVNQNSKLKQNDGY